MAKVKTHAVTVQWTVTRTVYVEARRPNGAIEKIQTPEGWREATRYAADDDLPLFLPKDAVITDVRPI